LRFARLSHRLLDRLSHRLPFDQLLPPPLAKGGRIAHRLAHSIEVEERPKRLDCSVRLDEASTRSASSKRSYSIARVASCGMSRRLDATRSLVCASIRTAIGLSMHSICASRCSVSATREYCPS
jgi:hypothetical protein